MGFLSGLFGQPVASSAIWDHLTEEANEAREEFYRVRAERARKVNELIAEAVATAPKLDAVYVIRRASDGFWRVMKRRNTVPDWIAVGSWRSMSVMMGGPDTVRRHTQALRDEELPKIQTYVEETPFAPTFTSEEAAMAWLDEQIAVEAGERRTQVFLTAEGQEVKTKDPELEAVEYVMV